MAGGGVGGGFAPPPPVFGVTALTTAPAGGWVQVIRPRAVYRGGYTYFGYIRGDNGHIGVRYVRHWDQSVGSEIDLATLEVDTHDDPAVFIRADLHLIVFYTKHATEAAVYYRVSTNPLDTDPEISGGFATAVTISHGTHQTYPSVMQLTAETNTPLYVFTRDTISGDSISRLVLHKSTDNGATWAAQADIVTKTPNLYWYITTNGTDRIDFAMSDGNAVSDNPTSIYHMYYEAGDYHKSDGTIISATRPFAPSAGTLVYASATAGPGWMTGIGRDGSGNIAISYEVITHATGGLGDQYSIRYGWWNGSSWTSNPIHTSVDTGLSYVNHSCLDEGSIDTVFSVKAVSGVFELSRYVTPDNGATWTATALTSGSSATGNIYPSNIVDRAAALRVLWLAGTYTSYLSNSLAIKGSA